MFDINSGKVSIVGNWFLFGPFASLLSLLVFLWTTSIFKWVELCRSILFLYIISVQVIPLTSLFTYKFASFLSLLVFLWTTSIFNWVGLGRSILFLNIFSVQVIFVKICLRINTRCFISRKFTSISKHKFWDFISMC